MTKKDYIYCSIFLILSVTGFFIGGYGGGLLSGLFLAILFFASVGKIVGTRAAGRIDKQIKDYIVQTQLDKDAN